MADPYSTLGVAKSASEAEIKSAYRKLAKELHPDKNKDNPKASEKFSDVTKAYDILSDKTKRAQFDRGEIDGEGNPAMPYGYGGGGFRGDQLVRLMVDLPGDDEALIKLLGDWTDTRDVRADLGV